VKKLKAETTKKSEDALIIAYLAAQAMVCTCGECDLNLKQAKRVVGWLLTATDAAIKKYNDLHSHWAHWKPLSQLRPIGRVHRDIDYLKPAASKRS
jgi:hypothetical protein